MASSRARKSKNRLLIASLWLALVSFGFPSLALSLNTTEIIKLQEEGRYGELLQKLALRFKDRPSAALFETADQAVRQYWVGIQAGNRALLRSWPFDKQPVRQFVAELVKSRPELRPTLAALFSWRTTDLVRMDDSKLATDYFDRVLLLRPDPSEVNQELRMAIALEAKSDSTKSFATGRIYELRMTGGLTPIRKVQLLLKGYYGSRYPTVLTAALALLVLSLILAALHFLLGIRLPTGTASSPKRSKNKSQAAAEPMDEYSRLLACFGLDDSASEDEIKAAYRQRMKELHPDAVGGVMPDANDPRTDDFRQLKHTYERILEMKKSSFFAS